MLKDKSGKEEKLSKYCREYPTVTEKNMTSLFIKVKYRKKKRNRSWLDFICINNWIKK